MRILRIIVATALTLSIATSALAQSPVPPPIAPAAQTPAPRSGKALVYTGAAVFAGGMATALYGFIRVGNGEYSTFGEATSRNKELGAAGLVAAFAGGTMMFLGSRASRYAPSVTPRKGGFAVEKAVSW
jgi:hypothetical protein